MKTEIRIFIADDHPIFRSGLRQIIESDARLKIVGEADDGDEAVAALEELKPDVAILDIDMPEKDGFEAVRLIRQKRRGGKCRCILGDHLAARRDDVQRFDPADQNRLSVDDGIGRPSFGPKRFRVDANQ